MFDGMVTIVNQSKTIHLIHKYYKFKHPFVYRILIVLVRRKTLTAGICCMETSSLN